jgi:sigma-E factor negative regulatory protein RseC
MLERAQVVAVEPGGVWVEAVQRSSCGSCQARSGCGQKALSDLGRPMKLWVACEGHALHAGDDVMLQLPAGGLATSALVMYVLPLLCMLVAAILAGGLGELASVLAAVLGLALGFLASRQLARRLAHNWTPSIVAQEHLLR